MKRRGFIKTSLVTVAAGASSSAAFGEIVVPMSENISHLEMENFISEMNLSMDRISFSGGNYINSLLTKIPDEEEQNFFRSSLRSLLLVGNFEDLSIKGQVHPLMQQRMFYSAPEINYSVSSSIDILKNMSNKSMEDIRTALSDNPDLGDQIMEALDLEAQSIGVSAARRRQMRIMGKRINRRLKHSPDMFINEYVKKADKLLLASNSDEAIEQILKAQVGEVNYSSRRNEVEIAALQWRDFDIHNMPLGYNPIITEQDDNKTSEKKSNLKTRKGLILLGIGGVTTAAGWIIYAVSSGMFGIVLGVTIGPILILIALIMLIISASKSSKSKK
jgi:hypothetical protein